MANMRGTVAKSIRLGVMAARRKKGLDFSKRIYRRAKKFYNLIPRTQRGRFNVVA